MGKVSKGYSNSTIIQFTSISGEGVIVSTLFSDSIIFLKYSREENSCMPIMQLT